MASEFYAGKRLSFDGQLCTVRYIGEVKGTKGVWLGVEWDDPTRGKHSGEHGGIKYFECLSKIPTAGSFVRPTRKSEPPRSFVEALKAKYASEIVEDPQVKIVHIGGPRIDDVLPHQKKPIRISGKEVEEVGFDKIRNKLAKLKDLRIVILDGLRMSRPIATLGLNPPAPESAWPEGLTDIVDACPKTTELDLSRNLFEEWREVASICEQLQNLKSLRVDGNRFRDTSITEAERPRCHSAFTGIRTLKLENTLLSWEQITEITSVFPSLTSFVASNNAFCTLSLHALPPTITDLTLEDNSFHNLSDLEPLTHLPNLRRLILKNNKISAITTPDKPPSIFPPTISEVDLSYNEISTWPFINALSHTFPGLTALRISQNPLYTTLHSPDGKQLSAEDGYILTIARLEKLHSLNYSTITDKERLNAEGYYLSLIARELATAPENMAKSILEQHPRYKWLCEEYGEPVIRREEGGGNPNALAPRLVKFKFHLGETWNGILKPDTQHQAEKGMLEIEVPMSFTSYALHGLVGKAFGLKPLKIKLVWETGDLVPVGRGVDAFEDETWDSESSDGEGNEGVRRGVEMVVREVEIVPGTKLVGTWVDGNDAVVRVEGRI